MDAALPRDAAPARPSRLRPILRLGAPLAGFYLIPTAVSVAAVAMLGHLGDAAIAGVGAASAIYTALCALLWGVDTGVQAIVARAVGAGRSDRIGQILASAYAGAIPLALTVGAVAWAFGPHLVALILPSPAAAAAGGAWIAAAAPSIGFLSLTLPINAAWIASGRPGFAAAVTAFSAPAQIALTFLFILGAGPIRGVGAAGGAWAMDTVMLGGVFVQGALALRYLPGFLRARPSGAILADVVAIGWPISGQQSLLQVALMGVFAIIAHLGAAPAAIASVLLTLTNAPVQIETALGSASATLVGQSLGRRDPGEARAWGWRTSALALAITAPMGVALMLAPHALLGVFLHDPATLAAGIWPARIAGFTTAIGAPALVLGYSFRGAGATKIAAAMPFVSLWLLELPLMAWIGIRLHRGLTGIIAVQAGVIALDAVVLAAIWASPIWTRVRIEAAAAGPAALPASLQRIAILGGGGAGKSTLARRLGAALGLPVVHLDTLVFGPGWKRRPTETTTADLAAAIAPGAWIVEGTYAEASALTMPDADLVLWLDQPRWRRLWRCWRKTVRHRDTPRADRPDDCEEAFTWRYAWMTLSFGHWSPRVAAWLDAAAGTRLRRLKGDGAVRRFLAEVEGRGA